MKFTYETNTVLSSRELSFINKALVTSYQVTSCTQQDTKIVLLMGEEVDEHHLSNTIKQLLFVLGSIQHKIHYKSQYTSNSASNPLPYLTESGAVIPIENGLFAFQGDFLAVATQLNNKFRDIALTKYQAIEQEYPLLWPIEIFKKTDYLKEFPHHAILTTSVKNSYPIKREFSESFSAKSDFESIPAEKFFDEIRYGLSPSVCTSCYFAMSNTKQNKNNVYTTYNKVFRNEYSEKSSLDRLMNFSVRDIMFVGDKDFVLEMKRKLSADLCEYLNQLNLEFSLESADDPFFSGDVSRKLFQHAFDLKEEFLARVPYAGSHVAIGSINVHLDTFSKAFEIRTCDGEYAYSGCVGIGFERLVYVLFCQHGHKIEKWPADLRTYLCI